MTIDINGMAHVILTVSRFDAAQAFYGRLLPALGMKIVHDGERLFYCVGARTAIGVEPCDPAHAGERFVQQRVGLHHLCLRARSRDDVDEVAALLREMNATIVRGPLEGNWAPGYYYRLLLCAVRRPGRDQARSEFRARRGRAGGRRAVQPRQRLSLSRSVTPASGRNPAACRCRRI